MSGAAREDEALRRRAIDPRRSFIVQAPAGSGKTSLLAMRYLRLLADVESPEQIVAITFTRRAAAEMRHRILEALEAAARPAAPDLQSHQREMRALAEAALAASRRRGWGLEHNPARLHIQTIDGLNHWLARRLPLASRIGAAATLVDDAQPLYAEAGRRTVARLDAGGPEAALLERLARALDHDPRQLASLIAGMLETRELWLPKLLGQSNGPELRASIDRLLGSAIDAELARTRGLADAAGAGRLFEVLRRAAAEGPADGPLAPLAALADWPEPGRHAVATWRALVDCLLTSASGRKAAFRRKLERGQGFLTAKEGPAWAVLKREALAELERLSAGEGLAEALCLVRELPPPALTDAQWERIEALCGVLPLAVAELLALFAERDRLDHAAVAAAAREALGSESAPTELALALDYRIRHLLVDEYQDTSPSQERLLELLVAGWQPGDGRTLFCVGDPMQSIYGFREADVTLFLQAARHGIGAVKLEPARLGLNFRSSRAIVDWVNGTFGRLLPPADDFERGAVRYAPAEAQSEGHPGDGVEVHALLDADEQAMAARVADVAARALALEGDQAVKSIAILVRGRASLPPILAALRAARIEYRGVELETLAQRAAVRDLVALTRALLHAGDRTAWLAVLRAPWCGLALADLLALAGTDAHAPVPALLRRGDALAALSDDGRARAALLWGRLEAAIASRGERSLGGWVKSAWLALDGAATVEDVSDLANAELYFDALDRLEHESGCLPEASLVEAAVSRLMASPVGGESARVQVMTIHRAKGLEFDVVIVPDLQRGARGRERPLLYWTPVVTGPGERGIVLASRAEAGDPGATDPLERWMRRLAAEREGFELGRVAYVAATRAKRQLHLIGSATTRERDGVRELRSPPANTLQGFLWPVLAQHFEAALAAAPDPAPATEDRGRPRRTAPPPQRLAAGFASPAPPALALPPPLRIAGTELTEVRPEFDWAGAVAQAVGQVVHFELHQLVRARRPPAALAPRPALWQRMLRRIGIDDAHLPEAVERVARALERVSKSRLAAQLLDPGVAEGASELALTVHLDGVVQGLRVDRSFVDETGTRWIVDWKTSAHEGGDAEAFLDNELARYAPQLRRYAAAFSLLDGRPQRVGLYFPYLDAWREI